METAFSGASNLAEAVDRAFIFIFSIAFIITIAITGLIIYILIHYRRMAHLSKRLGDGLAI